MCSNVVVVVVLLCWLLVSLVLFVYCVGVAVGCGSWCLLFVVVLGCVRCGVVVVDVVVVVVGVARCCLVLCCCWLVSRL